MNKIEKLLLQKQNTIDKLEAPPELETRLRLALNNKSTNVRPKDKWLPKIAIACVLILFLGWQSDSLAFYGKKIIGYDHIMNTTLRELSELGKGQTIGKSTSFTDGLTITLDGIMLDDNQLLAFFTVKTPNGKLEEFSLGPKLDIKGIFGTYNMNHAQGRINEEKNEIKYIASFEPPFFMEKKLKFKISNNNYTESKEISFTLNRKEATGQTVKKTLNYSINVDDNVINLDSISASPTVTIISGTIKDQSEHNQSNRSTASVTKGINSTENTGDSLDIKLLANGKPINHIGESLTTDIKGTKFTQEFDALPKGLESLKILIESFSADHDVEKVIPLKKDLRQEKIYISGQEITINQLNETDGNTYLTITSKEDIALSKVYLVMDGNKVPLQQISSKEYNKTAEGIFRTRTLHFSGTGNNLELYVERITYNTKVNKIIDISLN